LKTIDAPQISTDERREGAQKKFRARRNFHGATQLNEKGCKYQRKFRRGIQVNQFTCEISALIPAGSSGTGLHGEGRLQYTTDARTCPILHRWQEIPDCDRESRQPNNLGVAASRRTRALVPG
jgi:hypothetical protein